MPAVQCSAAQGLCKMRLLLVCVSDTKLVFYVGIAHFCQGEMLLCNTAGEALMGNGRMFGASFGGLRGAVPTLVVYCYLEPLDGPFLRSFANLQKLGNVPH